MNPKFKHFDKVSPILNDGIVGYVHKIALFPNDIYYEISSFNADGNPVCYTFHEQELELAKDNGTIGFKKEKCK